MENGVKKTSVSGWKNMFFILLTTLGMVLFFTGLMAVFTIIMNYAAIQGITVTQGFIAQIAVLLFILMGANKKINKKFRNSHKIIYVVIFMTYIFIVFTTTLASKNNWYDNICIATAFIIFGMVFIPNKKQINIVNIVEEEKK